MTEAPFDRWLENQSNNLKPKIDERLSRLGIQKGAIVQAPYRKGVFRITRMNLDVFAWKGILYVQVYGNKRLVNGEWGHHEHSLGTAGGLTLLKRADEAV